MQGSKAQHNAAQYSLCLYNILIKQTKQIMPQSIYDSDAVDGIK